MIRLAPMPMALVMSPENLIPPSAIIGMSYFTATSGAVVDGGHLRYPDPGDDSGGADRSRAHADLDAVGPGPDQVFGAFGGGDVAGDDLQIGEGTLDLAQGVEDVLGVAVGGIETDDVNSGL